MPQKYLPYNKDNKEFSRDLRNESTLGEVLLWRKLRASQLGHAFNRQKPLGNYIADFYCRKLGLVIEIDGASHFNETGRIRDVKKQTQLELLGLEILRFTEKQVRSSMNDVVRCIQVKLRELEEKKGLVRPRDLPPK